MSQLGSWVRAAAVLGAFLVIPACSKNNQSSNPPTFESQNTTAATGPGAGEITMTWTPATDFSGTGITYFVWVANTEGGENLNGPAYATTTNPTGTTLQGLVSGNHYWMIVQAIDGDGNSDGNTTEIGGVNGITAG